MSKFQSSVAELQTDGRKETIDKEELESLPARKTGKQKVGLSKGVSSCVVPRYEP